MSYDFSKYKDDTLTRPRDEAWSNWKSWKDAQEGDTVKGFIADAFYRPEERKADNVTIAFREQRGLTIRQENGELINVGVKYLPFVLSATDNLRVGDPIVVEFTKTLQPQSKGENGAKVFSYFGKNLPENAGNKTVKELTDEDRLAGGSTEPLAKAEDVSEEDDAFSKI
jgi:hypothetical protein